MYGDSRGHFYPRPPRGGRLNNAITALTSAQFLSTPSARRATAGRERQGQGRKISIHALREEGDALQKLKTIVEVISIHALREEGDTLDGGMVAVRLIFLSTPSARRATAVLCSGQISPAISIHALREEGDRWMAVWLQSV